MELKEYFFKGEETSFTDRNLICRQIFALKIEVFTIFTVNNNNNNTAAQRVSMN